MIEQLLTLSRLETDENNFAKEKFDLGDLAQSISKIFQEKIAEKNLTLELFNQDQTSIKADKTYIEILLSNLLENAIKIAKKSEQIIFKISNSGGKISAEEIKKIFDNFYRINKSELERSVVGSGLGLSISKKIVGLHRGSISFKSIDEINSVEIIL